MSDKPKYPPIVKTALDERKLALYGKKPEGAQRAPKMVVSVMMNNPRFTVFTGNQSNEVLIARMDSPSFIAVLESVFEAIETEPGFTRTFVNMTGAPSNMVEDTRLTVGKNNKGIIFLSVYKGEGDRIIFPFLPSMYHKVYGDDGEVEPGKLSCLYAKAWCTILTNLIPNVLDTHYVEPPPYQKNGGGNYNRGGGNSGGQSKGGGNTGGGGDSTVTAFDGFDDMPM